MHYMFILYIRKNYKVVVEELQENLLLLPKVYDRIQALKNKIEI